ncbi:chemotaxis protein CheA [Desulfurobacterium atlanticum]|uniref:histidine kinase n=1 Tax=Desulfurobacterium atlanticum TaxID=240169 RepID=A0A238ZZM3_9BACT|nr:chemotaxis protein CheA [Desulfurobacterium atlanticum]SNR88481.1 two-component system, chemotaxis family, sensor kinase CheA [Desulfurobacterium atlanticum]
MKINIPPDMQEIFEEFLVEASEILDNLDQDLIDLENSPEDSDLINRIFRGMHTLKGGAGFLNLTTIVELAHRMEDIFNKVRNGELKITSDQLDILFEGLDRLKEALDMLKEETEIPDPEDIDDILKKLDSILEGDGTANSSQESVSESSENSEDTNSENEEKAQNKKIKFKADVPEELRKLIEKYPDKDLAGLLEEIILMPPEERPMDIIPVIEKLIEEGKEIKDLIEVEEEKTDFGSGKVETTKSESLQNKPQQDTQEVSTTKTSKEQTSKSQAKSVSKEKKKSSDVIRIDVERIENLMNLVGEIVLDRNRIMRLISQLEKEVRSETIEQLNETVISMDRTVSDLQVAVMKLRMQPIKKIFSKFPRIVRDLSKKLGKKVNLVIEGEDTELDKSILDKLEDPLIHLVRNSLDHGLETPEERVMMGKPEVGTIKLFAYHEGDHIIIGISDDGRGINVEKVKQKAIEKGLITPDQARQMSDKDAYSLILMPGFSTKDQVTELSGRGVGMDVVASVIYSLRGTIEIDSEEGKGTTIILKLPLTVAIIRTLIIGVNNQIFSIPLHAIIEIVKYEEDKVKSVGRFKSLVLRDEVLPLFSLNELLGIEESEDKKFVVVVKVGEKFIAVAVDKLYGEEEIVIKSMGELLEDVPGIAGATIAGDGRVILILDINSLLSDIKKQLLGVL